jgi:hypothetical protein
MATPTSGQLVRATGSKEVYLIVFGERCWVPNPKTFENLFLNWKLVREVSREELDSIPIGPALTDGASLVAAEGVPAKFLVSWGMLNLLPPQVFDQYGFNPQKVTQVPASHLPELGQQGWTFTP